MATPNTLEELLTAHDVARVTGLSVASVRRWRLLKTGPVYIKISSAVRYKPEDLKKWLDSRPTGGGHLAADSGARRTGFRGEREKRSGVKTNTIPG